MTDSLKVGVVGVPGGWSSEALADAIAERTGFRLLVEPARIELDLGSGTVRFDEVDLCTLDGLVIKKMGDAYGPAMLDRLEVLRFVQAKGVRIFSPPEAILRLVDRLSCTVTLRAAGIPMPPTVVTEDPELAVAAVRRYGKAVLKPLYSTKARGMELVDASADVGQIVADFKAEHQMLYIQQALDLPDRDLGVVFIGGEHVGTYARVRGAGSWNTTIAAGGNYAPHDPSPEIIALAHRAQSLFGLDFTSVDVVETAAGPLVFEVSAFGGFRGAQEGTEIEPASHYADYVLKALRGRGR